MKHIDRVIREYNLCETLQDVVNLLAIVMAFIVSVYIVYGFGVGGM